MSKLTGRSPIAKRRHGLRASTIKVTNQTAPIAKKPAEKMRKQVWKVPQGYTLVRKGDVYITRHCRLRTEDSGREVYVVVGKTTSDKIGIQVPTDVYREVKKEAAATAASRLALNEYKEAQMHSKARAALVSAYPKIPERNRDMVIKHAFKKRSGRVGRTTKLPLQKIILLAVEAHIRHTQTKYDQLLKKQNREEARKAVRDQVATIKKSWS